MVTQAWGGVYLEVFDRRAVLAHRVSDAAVRRTWLTSRIAA